VLGLVGHSEQRHTNRERVLFLGYRVKEGSGENIADPRGMWKNSMHIKSFGDQQEETMQE
jgi:hypothetical protein